MGNFLGKIKEGELKIIDAGESGNYDELVDCAFDCVRFLKCSLMPTKYIVRKSEN